MKHLRKPPAQPQTPAQAARTAANVRASRPHSCKHLRKLPAQPQTTAQDARRSRKVRASHPYAPLMSNAKSFIEIILTKSEDVL